MIVVCPFDGQEYETEEYGRSHPDAVFPCGCWISLHPDGSGGHVAPDKDRQRRCRQDHDDEVVVTVEFHDEPMVLVKEAVRYEGELVDGWVTKPKPVDTERAILTELRLMRADQRREIRALRREIGTYLNDHTNLLGKIVDYYTPRQDADPEEQAAYDRWFISQLKKTGRYTDEEIVEMVMPVKEHSDFEFANTRSLKRALKELAEEAGE